MDTLVTIEVIEPASPGECVDHVRAAFAWFGEVERVCNRFDEDSEVMSLCRRARVPVEVSPLLYKVIEFALAVAAASDGAFDPTVGLAQEARGFVEHYISGRRVAAKVLPDRRCSYRDVRLDPGARTVTLVRPLVLDLGAVAKGLATDLAAQQLDSYPDFAINAGGDVLVRGLNRSGTPWCVGIAHPRLPGALIEEVHVTDVAVCTSGDYERARPDGGEGHHIIEPETGRSPAETASATVIAPTAMAADALSTAAFVLGPARGLQLLEREGVEGLIISPALERHATRGFQRFRP